MDKLRDFIGPNAAYLSELYERYLRDPLSVDPQTRAFFETSTIESPPIAPVNPITPVSVDTGVIAAAVNYIKDIRTYGHLAAKIDPLGITSPMESFDDLQRYGLSETELSRLPAQIVGGPLTQDSSNAYQAIQKLQEIYSTTRGYEYGHIRVEKEREWLFQAAESGRFRPPSEPFDDIQLLDRLTKVEVFEQFLHRFFPGKTRFSIEGLDILVPMLDEMVCCAADATICTILIGMAHRGRLNILAHILGKSYSKILAEFKEPNSNFSTIDQLGWTGDVKYHKGARLMVKDGEEIKLIITMAPNPSHLEFINPVVEGMARASDSKTDQPGEPIFYPMAALPILIHGDAAFPAEGVAAETLNLSRLPGYATGGTVHIIANNQLGFTTTTREGRSTYYASDLAKGFEIPILHVNADDPVACIEAARTALAYRNQFLKDFMIDLVGYRRYGHNEGDEPSFTQPIYYRQVEAHPSLRKIWADHLIEEGKIKPELPDQLVQQQMVILQNSLNSLNPEAELILPKNELVANHAKFIADTRLPLDYLADLNRSLLEFPDGFSINHKLERYIQRRRKAFENPDETSVDWSTAEELAFATILSDGIPIRLTGQDTERGTFSQRHAVFHDVETGTTFSPLIAIPQAKAAFDLHNSPLSENAALGFEFGYSAIAPMRMNVWEAQYGDFINSAQVMVDELLVSSKAKWEQPSTLVLLLPHGYEGQGPDHSSARPERFLNLAAEGSLRMANATTAAQYFHLLRTQALLLQNEPLPLVILTPKSLLRHAAVASSPRDLAEGRWHAILDDPWITQPDRVQRILVCTGKIAVDLMTNPEREKCPQTAIIRMEQLLPFPEEQLHAVISRYKHAEEVAWVQEEPENMGAWSFINVNLRNGLPDIPIRYIGRAASSSPAEGYTSWHEINQNRLITQALNLETAGNHEGVIVNKGEKNGL